VTRFFPMHRLQHLPPTPLSSIERALAIGRAAGLKFVYAGNVPGHGAEDTVCYSCGRLNVRRVGYTTETVGLNGSACAYCGADLNFRPQAA
jgi:pyruvate formate lyase activating enzyme